MENDFKARKGKILLKATNDWYQDYEQMFDSKERRDKTMTMGKIKNLNFNK